MVVMIGPGGVRLTRSGRLKGLFGARRRCLSRSLWVGSASFGRVGTRCIISRARFCGQLLQALLFLFAFLFQISLAFLELIIWFCQGGPLSCADVVQTIKC